MHKHHIVRRLQAIWHSQRGHNIVVFALFVLISAVLWMVTAVNEETQLDVRMPVRVTHLPDTVTIVSAVPRTVSVSMQGRGSQMLKLSWGNAPAFNIDYRVYSTPQGTLTLTETDMKGIARNALDGANIIVVSPDSLRLAYTTSPPERLPVNADYIVTAGPQASITGRLKLSSDSADVYTVGKLPQSVGAITTEPIRLSGINQTTTRRVRLVAPRGARVIPDSIDVTVEVEPLIFKTRKVAVEPRGVPEGMRLITFPAQIEVMYMIPLTQYKTADPTVRVVADYRTVADHPGARTVKLKIVEASDYLENVHLAADSAEYILERL